MTIAGAIMAFLLVSGFIFVITIVFAAPKESNANLTGMARLRHNITFAIIAAGLVVVVASAVATLYDSLTG